MEWQSGLFCRGRGWGFIRLLCQNFSSGLLSLFHFGLFVSFFSFFVYLFFVSLCLSLSFDSFLYFLFVYLIVCWYSKWRFICLFCQNFSSGSFSDFVCLIFCFSSFIFHILFHISEEDKDIFANSCRLSEYQLMFFIFVMQNTRMYFCVGICLFAIFL